MSDEAFPILVVEDLGATTRRFYERLGFSVRYQFPPEGEPGFITMARGPPTIGFGAGADDDDRYGYWVCVADVDATLGPVLISCRHGHTLATASTAAALAGLRAAGAPVVYLGAPV